MSQIEREMDAAELMEWVAYSNIKDDDYRSKLEAKMALEQTDKQKNDAVRNLLMSIT